MRDKCKYYNSHLETIREYISCLYNLEGCSAGGLLHIILDDGNCDDDNLIYCWTECIFHPEREESKLGKLICEEYIKLNMPERRLLCSFDWHCLREECNCSECYIEIGDEFED